MGGEQGTPGVGTGNGPGSVPTRFRPGVSGNPHGRRGRPGPPPGPWPATVAAQMRRVLDQPKAADRRPEEKALRAYLEKYPFRYLQRLADLERAAPAALPDPGSAEMQERIAGLLKKIAAAAEAKRRASG